MSWPRGQEPEPAPVERRAAPERQLPWTASAVVPQTAPVALQGSSSLCVSPTCGSGSTWRLPRNAGYFGVASSRLGPLIPSPEEAGNGTGAGDLTECVPVDWGRGAATGVGGGMPLYKAPDATEASSC